MVMGAVEIPFTNIIERLVATEEKDILSATKGWGSGGSGGEGLAGAYISNFFCHGTVKRGFRRGMRGGSALLAQPQWRGVTWRILFRATALGRSTCQGCIIDAPRVDEKQVESGRRWTRSTVRFSRRPFKAGGESVVVFENLSCLPVLPELAPPPFGLLVGANVYQLYERGGEV